MDTLPIFDGREAYATTFLCILLPQYIFELVPSCLFVVPTRVHIGNIN